MIRTYRIIFFLSVLFFIFPCNYIFAGYYHWVDENGVDHYSNVNTSREIKFKEKKEVNNDTYSSSDGDISSAKGPAEADTKNVKITPLYKAIRENNIAQVKSILSGDSRLINKIGEEGWRPLHWAAANGKIESVKYLLEKGAKINSRHGVFDSTPLHYAVYYGKFEIVKFLVEKGADVNIYAKPKRHLIGNSYGETGRKNDMKGPPLYTAVHKGRMFTAMGKRYSPEEPFEIAVYLIKNGADYSKERREGHTIYERFCKYGRRTVMNHVLTLANAPKPNYPVTARELSYILNRIPQDESDDNFGYTSFFRETLKQNPTFAKEKFTRSTPIGVIKNETLLHDAVYGSNFEPAQLLIKYGASVNAKNSRGKTPLHSCSRPERIRYLVENGANVNIKDNQGKTALHHLVKSEYSIDSIKYLLSKGASPYARDKYGKSPIDIAKEKNYQHYLKILR